MTNQLYDVKKEKKKSVKHQVLLYSNSIHFDGELQIIGCLRDVSSSKKNVSLLLHFTCCASHGNRRDSRLDHKPREEMKGKRCENSDGGSSNYRLLFNPFPSSTSSSCLMHPDDEVSPAPNSIHKYLPVDYEARVYIRIFHGAAG